MGVRKASLKGSRSLAKSRKLSAYAISKATITPKKQIQFHRKEAVKNLRIGNYAGFRYHSKLVSGINTRLVIARMRAKKGLK